MAAALAIATVLPLRGAAHSSVHMAAAKPSAVMLTGSAELFAISIWSFLESRLLK